MIAAGAAWERLRQSPPLEFRDLLGGCLINTVLLPDDPGLRVVSLERLAHFLELTQIASSGLLDWSRLAYGLPGAGLDALLEVRTSADWEHVAPVLSAHGMLRKVEGLVDGLLERVGKPPSAAALGAERVAAAAAGPWLDARPVRRLDEDPLDHHVARRLARVDIPVLIPDRRLGFLVGAELEFGSEPAPNVVVECPGEIDFRAAGLASDDWRPANEEFRGAVAFAEQGVRYLLAGLDADAAEWHIRRVRLHGILPPCKVVEGSAGLPFALAMLARAMHLPRPRLAASGAWRTAETLAPMEPPAIEAKARAVVEDGLYPGLLAPGNGEEMPAWQALSRHCLAEAAERAWGDAWNEAFGALLKAGPVRMGALHAPRPPGLRFRTEQATSIAAFFRSSDHPRAAILGGARLSGKTSIAHAAVAELGPDWHGLWLTCDGATATWSDVERLAGRWLGAHAASTPRTDLKRLIVVDGLPWPGDADATYGQKTLLGEALRHELIARAESFGVHLLVVVPSTRQTGWEYEGLGNFSGIGRREADLRAFTVGLIDQNVGAHPELEGVRSAVGAIVGHAGGDLGTIVALVEGVAGGRTVPEALDRLLPTQRLALLAPEARQFVGRLACLSVLGQDLVPRRPPPSVSPELLRALGAGGDDRGCRIFSEARAYGVLRALETPVAAVVGQEVLDRAYAGTEIARVPDLLHACAERLPHVLRNLLADGRRFVRPFSEWIDHRLEDPWIAARLIRILRGQRGGGALVDLLAQQLARWLSAVREDQAELCVRELRACELETFGDVPAVIEELAPKWLAKGTSYARGALLETLFQLRGPDGFGPPMVRLRILETLDEWLPGEGRTCATLAFRLLRLLPRDLRLGPDADDRDAASPLYSCVRASKRLADLARRAPDTDWPFQARIAWLGVRARLGVVGGAGVATVRIRSEAPTSLASGLSLLVEIDPATARSLLDETALGHFRDVLLGASCAEAAILLGAVGRVSRRSARRLLSAHRAELLERLAVRAEETADARGVGFLLRAVAGIDDAFRDGPGFGHELAERLGVGFFNDRLHNDTRVQVLFRLVQGLVACAPTYEKQIHDEAFHRVVEALGSPHQDWGPQLAVLLASSTEFGAEFVDRMTRAPLSVRQGIRRDVLEGMSRAQFPDVLQWWHELGKIWPDLARAFATELGLARDDREPGSSAVRLRPLRPALRTGPEPAPDEERKKGFAEGLGDPAPLEGVDALLPDSVAPVGAQEGVGGSTPASVMAAQMGVLRPESALRSARVVWSTLRSARDDLRWSEVVALPQPESWPNLMHRARRVGDANEALDLMRRIDPEGARAALQALLDPGGRLRQDASTVDLQQLSRLILLAYQVGGDEARARVVRIFEHRLRSLLIALLDEPDPRVQAQALRAWVDTGMDATQDARAILERWRTGESEPLRCPRAIAALVRAWARSLGPETARGALLKLDVGALGRRIAFGGAFDLVGACELAGVAWTLGSDDVAARLVRPAIAGDALPHRIGPVVASRLLQVAREVLADGRDAEATHSWAGRCAQSVPTWTGRAYLADRERDWTAVAWLAHHARCVGVHLLLLQRPRTLGLSMGRLRFAWVVAGLAPAPWVDAWKERFGRDPARWLPSGPGHSPAMALTVAARLGRIGDLGWAPDDPRWAQALHAPPSRLLGLLDEAVEAPALAAALRAHLPALWARAGADEWVAHPARRPLEDRLESLGVSRPEAGPREDPRAVGRASPTH